ncbi:hypothetical protein [Streptococcus sp. CSL10205-OR2]|uniref:hypothetical protein n=1 Tax=Streptococcus sp. CSL10205-OR2 TaxID=2980558 RepID=UPI0021DAAEF2|nr:hypothetical protein [Streptococcus sp. CSL10205-OR2]MCU9533698.1 hypothetical protein [Streptococcus sp. CSL10205-OR2]
MKSRDFITTTVLNLGDEHYETLKQVLVGQFISFAIIEDSEITKDIFAEKIYDYFEKLELKTNKPFQFYLKNYMNNLDEIVRSKIAKTTTPKKGEGTNVIVPRARKYYEKALKLKESRELTFNKLYDYTRIMLSLYSAIIENHYKEIHNMDYSIESINSHKIITSMKNEKEEVFLQGKKPKFNLKDLYSADSCTFIIVNILLNKMLEDKF